MIRILVGSFASILFLCVQAGATGVPLNVGTYNFTLDGGGGGSQATLGGVPVEIYCDDFLNEIFVPSSNSANVTQLTSSNLSATRFGEVDDWTTISLTGGTLAELGILNTSSATLRYDMVAYLVSLYNVPQNSNSSVHTANNQIQEAIWTLMDPDSYPLPKPLNPDSLDPSTYLEKAADWYLGGGATASFLSAFEVVSDVNMQAPGVGGGVGVGGFQEQIVMTPEPRGVVLLLLGVLAVCGTLMRRARRPATSPQA
jgi:hypothetical protein